MTISCCRSARRALAHWALTTCLIMASLHCRSVLAATVAEVVEQVSIDSYSNYLQNELYTHDGDERCFGPQHDLARDRILELFESFGLETSLHAFEYEGITCYNVVAVHRGISCPDEIFVLGAHYDTVEGAPGAWDNASGVAAVLESARVLSQHAFEGTIVFIAFDREEQGRFGSAAYVNDHLQDQIHGMINVDGIAWRAYGAEHPDYDKIGLWVVSEPTWLTDDLATALESYTDLTGIVDLLPQGFRSDHVSFDEAGFTNVYLASYIASADRIEGKKPNTFYHTPLDSVDQSHIDYGHGTQATQAVVGCLASQAMLAPAHIYPDFDGDGDVGMNDCLLLIDHWKGSDPQFDIAPPPHGDGVINDQDFAAVMHYWLSDRSRWWPEFGPIAHWKLDEIGGVMAYDIAGENHAELFGDPMWRPTEGVKDGAIELDGDEDFIGTEYVLDPSEGPFSVFAWIKRGAPGQTLVSQLWGANWLMADASSGYLKTDLRAPSHAAQPLVSKVTITDGDWHRVGMTWDGTNRLLYVDDVEVAADTQPSLARSVEGLNIGCGPDMVPGTFWSGMIDDVRIHNRAVKP